MKILVARLNHETNTFSPVPTPLEAFGPDGPSYDVEAYRENKGMRTAMSAFIDLAEEIGAELVTPVSATANPSGPVDEIAYRALCERILSAARGCDAVLLDLHGAMVARSCSDGEGYLLKRLRAAIPGVPVGVALDLHANMTEDMVANADVIVGFKTYPHIDMYETGVHAGRLLLNLLSGKSKPAMAWRRIPLLSHSLRSATFIGPMKKAVEAACAEEAAGSLGVSVFAGFALADIEAPCVSVVVVDASSKAQAQQTADRIARQIWADRNEFFYSSEPLSDSVARAKQLSEGKTKPVLLLDHGDNCTSGGTCDTMDVLEEAIRQGLDGIGVGPICDPEAVAQLIYAGEGALVTLDLGNKTSLDVINRRKPPMRVTGKVVRISDGYYTVTGPTYSGQRMALGRTVLLDIGPAEIVISERTHEPWDIGIFTCVGLKAEEKRFLLLKSRMYARPVFEPLAAALVECDSHGVTSSDFGLFKFKNLSRPVVPLDPAEKCKVEFISQPAAAPV
ncbi:M81 family metallopeptidase [Variovorax sp. HW608]|uniref:M81 family metallopeptidase n=1 Tax=Variovorax sp. HW608 TaxID=1034889 RepID=UPI000B5AFD24|nr:M81 family metallopeptidase [Variovorax sp. HW608]